MNLQVFLCASPLYPNDQPRDERLHVEYLDRQLTSRPPEWARLTVLQNGCVFPYGSVGLFRNPFAKSLPYNWLLCDANCEERYWMFLPEDCLVSPEGWATIRQHMEKGKDCFGLSKDPKAFVCRKGIFDGLSVDLQVMCDLNSLGKEIGGALLRGELERKGFHCITKNWQRISDEPRRWGNELYQEMNVKDHPVDVNKTRALPILQDYGIDGWKAPTAVLEDAFMKIIERSLDRQRESAERLKGLVCHYGPLITELPYRGLLAELRSKAMDVISGRKPES